MNKRMPMQKEEGGGGISIEGEAVLGWVEIPENRTNKGVRLCKQGFSWRH